MHNNNPTLSIGQNMLRVRAALMSHPATISLTSTTKKAGQRVFTPELAALVYAVIPPDVKQGARNTLRSQVASNIGRVIGVTPEAIKKIWSAEAHRNASLHAMRLSKADIKAFADKCQLTDLPYLQSTLSGL